MSRDPDIECVRASLRESKRLGEQIDEAVKLIDSLLDEHQLYGVIGLMHRVCALDRKRMALMDEPQPSVGDSLERYDIMTERRINFCSQKITES